MTTAPVADRVPVTVPRWYSHSFNRLAVYRSAAVLAAALPRPLRLRLAGILAGLLAGRLGAEQAVVNANLARIVPDAGPAERARLVAEVFRNFAICFADLIAANRRPRSGARLLAGIEGLEHLAAADAEAGIVVLTAHLGNWELAGRLLARDAARPTHVVVAAEPDPGVERFLRGGRGPVRFVVRRGPTSVLPLVAALRRGEVVALQGDRALGTRGDVLVPFFGAAAPFPLGPFLLARASGARVLPSFCTLTIDHRYVIRVGQPIEVEPGGEPMALGQWVAELEKMVRAHPDQWFNFFDVWRGPAGC